MNRFTFQQVESLFHTAADYDPPSRQLFLDQIAREHSPEIAAMVARLLSQDHSATRWTDLGLTVDPIRDLPEPEPPGTVVGHFRLLHRLGLGGYGEVYLAEQTEPIRRRVALKMVRLGTASTDAIARFRAEQQTLASMSHPNIAAVYEAGLVDRDRFYFAMEFVEGESIDAFCDARRLPVRQRLQLFLKVCRAVQHAHQKGVIHRDLKPSNIMVTERDGALEPVLIDFGIAIAASSAGRRDDDPEQLPRIAIGTPAFMSPEQADPTPRDIDTRSDIFSLGIVLYELLVSRTPLDILTGPDAPISELRRCILEASSPLPTDVLRKSPALLADAARNRQCSSRALLRHLRGDLESIVMKAVSRRREDRYQSLEAFASDIENVLQHRPVVAGSTTTWSQASRFLRRHRLPAAAAAVLMLALLGGIIGTSLGMVRAERAARESDAVNSFMQDLLMSSQAIEKGATVRFVDVLASGSAMASERLGSHPQRAGDVHYVLGHTYMNLGLYRDAQRELERSLALMRQSRGLNDAATLRTANTLANLFVVLLKLDEAHALASDVANRSQGQAGPLLELNLTSRRILIDVAIRRGEYIDAEREARELIGQIDAALGPEHIEAYNVRISLATTLERRSFTADSKSDADALREARIAVLEETIQLQETRYRGEASIPYLGSQIVLARAYLDGQRYTEAARLLDTLPQRIEERVGRIHGLYIEALMAKATLAYARGEYADAATRQQEALAASKSLHSPRHPNMIGVMRDTLPYLDAAGLVDEGLTLARELHDLLSTMFGAEHMMSVDAHTWIARFCDLAGLVEEAEEHFVAVRAAHHDPEGSHQVNEVAALLYAGHLARLGRFEEAEAELTALASHIVGVSTDRSDYPDSLIRMYIELYTLWSNDAKANEFKSLLASKRPR